MNEFLLLGIIIIYFPIQVNWVFQTGDSIKTLEKDYANRDFVENQIHKSVTQVKPAFETDHSPTPPQKKKPPRNRGLKNGAGEEGRTPDLMLGKHTL
jgi:hypothetical protein